MVHPKLDEQLAPERRSAAKVDVARRSKPTAAGTSPRFRPGRRRPEPASPVLGEPLRPPVRLAELGPQAVRLLEVVADELVELGEVRMVLSSRSA